MTTTEEHLHDLGSQLTLEEKVRLLTGRDFWTTWPIERIGLRRILVSDGPSGVRGETWDERSPSLNLPSSTALSSSWDPRIAHRYGSVIAAEARRKDVDVVLGPTINIHRSPLGGRHFEAFSEDPILTAVLAAAYVEGVQESGVGATPKHYVANDFETERFTADVKVSERALREVYLRAFEDAVTQAHAWLVMSAYNSINGATASENELLETPLNSEWGFDGVVISDWTAVRSLESAKHSQDLVMPGPDGPWGDALVQAVRRGEIDENVIDRKVHRILQLAARVGALEGLPAPAQPPTGEDDGLAFTREAAVEGSVLLSNDGTLPLRRPRRIAVIGHNAQNARTQGGGSARVFPASVVAPIDGIRAAFPEADITYSLGAVVQDGLAELAPTTMTNPSAGGPGARVEFRTPEGAVAYVEDRLASALVYFGGDAPVSELGTLVFTTDYTANESGTVRIGFAGVGHGRIYIDGTLTVEGTVEADGEDPGAALLAPPSVSAPVEFSAGQTCRVRLEFEPVRSDDTFNNALAITIGTEPDHVDANELITSAAAAAAAADVAIVVIGTNSHVESEGYDRVDLSLPGQQDALVEAVLAANPRTVVVVNSGSPVELPWRERAAAVLVTYFGGQEYGNALGDMLSGRKEPGGRLPTTWPGQQSDVPVLDVTPVGGVVTYEEGIHVGYRAWLKAGARPAFPFGHGLGYTPWALEGVQVTGFGDGDAVLTARVRNAGERAGKHVVQVYAEHPGSTVDRPVRWLVGFAVIRAEGGEAADVEIPIRRRELAYWDGQWVYEPGEYVLRVGSSVVDLPMSVTINLQDPPAGVPETLASMPDPARSYEIR